MLPTNSASTMLARMAREPLLIAPGSENILTTSISEMQAHEDFGRAHMETAQTDEFWDDDDEFMAWLRPYNVRGGTLVIPVHGVLIHKMSFKFGSGATGYEYIKRAFDRGMDDSEVHTIAFDFDSPGGMVAGNFELVEHVKSRSGEKAVLGFANDYAFSAAYSLASACDSITMTRSGGVGSVGVVTMHVDFSDAMDKRGIKVTFIFAGKHKVEGNPYQKLPEAARQRIQARIDRLYGEFVGIVAENRGMEEQAVRDTEALTYDATDAIGIGFADAIGTLEDELASQAATEESQMAIAPTKTKTPAAASNEDGQYTQADMDAAVAEARSEGEAAGQSAERERINGILGCEEAKDRPAAAQMAVSAGMTVEAAQEQLAKMPKETPQAAAPQEPEENADAPAPTPFAQVMEGPGVGADVSGGGSGSDGSEPDAASQILVAYSAQTGRDFGQKAS